MKQYLQYVSLAVGLTGLSLGIYFHSQAVMRTLMPECA
jgi:hypothetical protein